MIRFLVGGFWSAFFLFIGELSLARGQASANEVIEHGSTSLPYAYAVISTIVVLLIVCMPSRKLPTTSRESSSDE